MQTKSYLLATIATLLSLTHSAPTPDPDPKCSIGCVAAISGVAAAGAILINSDDDTESTNTNANAGSLKCSADTSDADVVPFAQDPAWASSMKGCLNQINNAEWNGYSCIPNNGNDTVIGIPFGFYKGAENVVSGQTCYDLCAGCLGKGIDNLRAVTTSCRWEGDGDQECWMGFNYGG